MTDKEEFLRLADYIERSRARFLDSMGTPLLAVNRQALQSVLWDDQTTIIKALRIAAAALPNGDRA